MESGDLVLEAGDPDDPEVQGLGVRPETWAGAALAFPGGASVHLHTAEPRPLRVRHLVRHPEGDRVLAPATGPVLVVVLREEASAAPSLGVVTVPPGSFLRIPRGVWHAGPMPLAAGPLLEVLEGGGSVDRLDRRSLADLTGHGALRILTRGPWAGGSPPSDSA